jgi:hypothetical protein
MPNDGFWLLILHKGQAFVPTTAKTEAGFYLSIEPIDVIDTSDERKVEEALLRAIGRGNPAVPTPSRADYSRKPALLRLAKAKSRASFERVAKSWKLSKRQGAYFIVPYRHREDSGAEEDTERGEAIPADVPLEEVVHRLVRRALGTGGSRGTDGTFPGSLSFLTSNEPLTPPPPPLNPPHSLQNT